MSKDGLRDKRSHHFFQTDNNVIDDHGKRIGVYGFAVYSLLVRIVGQNGNAFPSYKSIAETFGFSERKAVSTVDLLVKAGLIGKGEKDGPETRAFHQQSIHAFGPACGAAPHHARRAPSRCTRCAASYAPGAYPICTRCIYPYARGAYPICTRCTTPYARRAPPLCTRCI